MKKLLFALFATACFATVATAQSDATTMTTPVGGPVATFEKTEINYGVIAQNSDPLRKFKFKNTGTEPFVIKNAQGSCGCTVPSYKHEPVLPGESSEIEVRYATDRIGVFTKTVTLTTNEATPTRVLVIKGEVLAKAVDAGVPTGAPSVIATPK